MFGVVIDEQGYKIEFVALNADGTPQRHELQEGETIIKNGWQIAIGMNKPRWTGSEWIDTDPLPPIEIPPQEPNEMEVLEGKVMALEESQVGQDCIIDDLIFEVIPMLEQQINVNNTQPVQLASVLSNKLIKGESAMAAYLAKKIMDGRDYQAVFKTYSYKMYQDEVDTILELEGRGDLIKR